MKNINRITWILCFLLASLCMACSENTIYIDGSNIPGDNDTPGASNTIKGHISLNGKTAESVSTVETISAVTDISDGDFSTSVPSTNCPQVIIGKNSNDELTFMYRGNVNGSETVEMNEYTTAVALFTMHPAFWSLAPAEYGTLETTVRSLSGYNDLVKEVRNVLASGKPLMDSSNKDLIEALKTCYKQFCSIYSTQSVSSASAPGLPLIQKAKGDDGNYDYFPIEFSPESNTMAIRVIGLAPPYECRKIVNGEVTENKLIMPNTTYGLSDLGKFIVNGFKLKDYAEAYKDVNRGEWNEFDMKAPTDYDFMLDRTTTAAKDAQKCFYALDVLSMVGILGEIKVKNTKTQIVSPLLDDETQMALTDAVENLKMDLDPTTTNVFEWAKSYYDSILNIVYNHLSSNDNNLFKNAKLFKYFTKAFNFYDNVSAVFSILGRTYMDNTVPAQIEQCFSQHNSVITTCNGTGISVKSGNGQIGEPGQQLSEPIVFSVICNLGQRVKVEVTQGNGTLSRYYLTPKAFDGTTQYVSTEWTLDDKTVNQTLTAYIVDVATDIKQSPECIVNATLSNGSLLSRIGDTYYFSYDSKGRIGTITDRTCMLVEPNPDEIITTKFEYKNDEGNELSRIVMSGDGETTTLSNIKQNDKGLLESFKWSSSDIEGTESGTGIVNYESDGRISKMVSSGQGYRTAITFYWEDGLLKQIYMEDTDEEITNESFFFSYGSKKNVHLQYPAGIAIMELGSLFFSGLYGPGPRLLPNRAYGEDADMTLQYTTRSDGYIMSESIKASNNPLLGYNFAYTYVDKPDKTRSFTGSGIIRSQTKQGLFKRRPHRIFGLFR